MDYAQSSGHSSPEIAGAQCDLRVRAAAVYVDAVTRAPHGTLVIRNGAVESVGVEEDGEERTRNIPTIDFEGGYVVPGFIDAHAHMFHSGLTKFAVALREAKTRLEVAEQLRAVDHKGDLILATGLNHYVFADELPDGRFLDGVMPGRAVVLKGITGHFYIANARAVALLGIPENVPGAEPGGMLKGEASALAASLVRRHLIGEFGARHVLDAAAQMALSRGITTIHAMEGADEPQPVETSWFLESQSQLSIRTIYWAQTTNVQHAVDFGLPRIGGDIWVDGDFGPRTALLREPYSDGSGVGISYYRAASLAQFAHRAREAGIQVSVHCVGDGAVEMALDAYAGALEDGASLDHRWRIEHFQIGSPDLIERSRSLGVAVSLQPSFDHCFGGQARAFEWLGHERSRYLDRLRAFRQASLLVGGGSDSPVTPLDPMVGVHAAVNHSNAAERLRVEEALEMFTRGSAQLAFRERDLGGLAPGMAGDFAVLDADPHAVTPEAIKDIKVLATVVGGSLRHQLEGMPS